MTWSERLERVAWILGLVATAIALTICGLELGAGTPPLTNEILGFVGSASCGLVWIAGAILFIVSILSMPKPRRERYHVLALFIALSVAGMFVVMRGWYVITDGLAAWENHRVSSADAGRSSGGADYYFDRGLYQEAAPRYSEAIRLYPDWAEAYYKRGMCYYWLHDYEEAIADFEEATRLDRGLAGAFYGLGDTYLALGRYEEAIEDYNEAIRLDPESADPYFGRAAAYYERGWHSEVISDCNSALSLSPGYREAYRTRGWASNGLGDYEGAIADYSAALDINPSYHEIWCDRGRAYVPLGEYEKAAADYSEAIRLDASYAQAYCQRGIVYQELDREDEALEDFQSCLALATDDERLRDEAQGYIEQIRQR
jgi:tetratricopeptide (TPR) repeat protein